MLFASVPAAFFPSAEFPFTFSPTLAGSLPNGYEWLVIGLIALLIFGKRLPGAARGVGQAIREFKNGLNGNHAQSVAEAEPSATAGKTQAMTLREG